MALVLKNMLAMTAVSQATGVFGLSPHPDTYKTITHDEPAVDPKASEESTTKTTTEGNENSDSLTENSACDNQTCCIATAITISAIAVTGAVVSYFVGPVKCDSEMDHVEEDMEQMKTLDKILETAGLAHDPKHPDAQGSLDHNGYSPLWFYFCFMAGFFTLVFIGLMCKSHSYKARRRDIARRMPAAHTDISDNDFSCDEDDEETYYGEESYYGE